MSYECIMCGSGDLEILEGADCEVYMTGSRKKFLNPSPEIKKVICKNCGHIQHLQNEAYGGGVNEVFHHYGILHNKSFQSETGRIELRERLVIEKIVDAIELPEQGNMLDIGCGGGEALGFFHELQPEWDLYGMEIDDEFRDDVLAHKGIKGFFTSMQELISSNIKFELITINYVMSVANNPYEILTVANEILSETGVLFMVDTDFEIQPYSLYIIEHSSFWNKASFESACDVMGFEIMNTEFNHEMKEMWVFCKKGNKKPIYKNLYNRNKVSYMNTINYLNMVIEKISVFVKPENCIGIFGMSCAGIWVCEIIEKKYMSACRSILWVEEDEEILSLEIGVNGYPIRRIEEIENQTFVLLPFPTYIAYSIKKRLERKNKNVEFVLFD